jgi:hypothetical protein
MNTKNNETIGVENIILHYSKGETDITETSFFLEKKKIKRKKKRK